MYSSAYNMFHESVTSSCFCGGQDAFGADDPSLEWVSFPMGCIKAVTQADDDSLAITITAKVRFCLPLQMQ